MGFGGCDCWNGREHQGIPKLRVATETERAAILKADQLQWCSVFPFSFVKHSEMKEILACKIVCACMIYMYLLIEEIR